MLILFTTISIIFQTIFCLYSNVTYVTLLNDHNFESHFERTRDEVWILQFYSRDCAYCKNFTSEYIKTAKALHNFINFAVIDAEISFKLAEKFRVKIVPSVKFIGFKDNKTIEYNGPRRAEDLINAILDKLNQKAKESLQEERSEVVELSDENFERFVRYAAESWFVQFYAPWCEHCKKFKSVWEEVAVELKDKINCGALDVTMNTVMADKYNILHLPALMYFRNNNSGILYKGERIKSHIIHWATERYLEQLPPPIVYQIINEKSFSDNCLNQNICVITILPELYDCQSECRNKYLKLVETAAYQHRRYGWSYVWAEANQQIDLENSLELGGSGYPALTVLNPRKMKHSVFKGSFEEANVIKFLENIVSGKGEICELKGGEFFPEIADAAEWDGKDADIEENLQNDVVRDEL